MQINVTTPILLSLLIGCTNSPSIQAGAAVAPNYELRCAPANTSNAAMLQCARTDTRTGDVVVVDYMRLPTSNGSTAVGTAPAGQFTTVCDAASTATRADFYCVRLNTVTGEMLLVNLTKVSVLPPRPQ
jgi:hypothetical protein